MCIRDSHLFAAALSPVLALHAPEADATPVNVAVTGAPQPAGACPALLQHTFNRLQTGEQQSLCQFQGKVLVVVNTASHCGNTPQYEGLEAMYRKYKDKGLVVVGFPSNDFGAQEPGTNKEIAEFCRTTYGIQFPLFEKASASRLPSHPLYAELIRSVADKPATRPRRHCCLHHRRVGGGVTTDCASAAANMDGGVMESESASRHRTKPLRGSAGRQGERSTR